MTFDELIKSINEKNLSQWQLEELNGDLTRMYGMAKRESAELKKQKALFIYEKKAEGLSHVDRVNAWDVTEKGQRLIELKDGLLPEMRSYLDNLKSRLIGNYGT